MVLKPTAAVAANTAGSDTPDFLAGGGEMGLHMRCLDWSSTSLGPPADWPQALRTSVRLLLNTEQPSCIWWGHDRTFLFNAAYSVSFRPPRLQGSLGRPALQVWEENWDVTGEPVERMMGGNLPTSNVEVTFPGGRPEEASWTCSYVPIDDEGAPGGIGGVLALFREMAPDQRASEKPASDSARVVMLLEEAPIFLAVLGGPELRFEMANAAFRKLVGPGALFGRTFVEAMPAVVSRRCADLLDTALTTGQACFAKGIGFGMPANPGDAHLGTVVDFIFEPVRDVNGSVTGVSIFGTDISERASDEIALRESEERFRAALKAGRLGSWETDNRLKTRTWTAEGMALFGLSLQGGIGHVGGLDDEYVRALHPDDRYLVQSFQELADQQDSFPAEYRIVRPDGSKVWLQGRGLVVSRSAEGKALRLVSIMADVSERKQAEERARVQHERLDLALSAGRMGAYDMDLLEGVLWWSAQTYDLFGVDRASFVPSPASVLALLHPEDREGFARVRAEAFARREPFVHEFRVVRPGGSHAWLGHRGQAEYDAKGQIVRSFGITMDITEVKHAEEVLRDADRNKDRFIAILAHELRNPLAPIKNAIQVLRLKGAADATAQWCHDVIDRQVAQMARLLEDLLDASRIARQQLQIRPQVMSLSVAIERAIEIARPLIAASGHSFQLKVWADDMVIDGDAPRLAQVFSNILINAAKYTPSNGTITLDVKREGDRAVVRITDNGIGIEAQHLSSIFEIFGQVESALIRSQGGQGIGLSLAKGLIEMHGGTIAVQSKGAGQGSEFELTLPLSSQRSVDYAPTGATPDLAGGITRRILIAEDLRDTAESLALALRALGHVVDVAYDGEQALHQAEALRPDVILMDLGMPKINGIEVCQQIRAAPWGKDIVLIAQTGWGQPDIRRRTSDAGFDHHLVKPVEIAALVALL